MHYLHVIQIRNLEMKTTDTTLFALVRDIFFAALHFVILLFGDVRLLLAALRLTISSFSKSSSV